MNKLYAITVFFNPAGFHNLLNNYYIFQRQLKQYTNVELMTIELSFNGQFQIEGDNVHRLTSNSIMWQKERLINYGISQLPNNAEYFAWMDCDILFLQPNWLELTLEKLQTNDIVQMFKKVYFGTKGETEFSPFFKTQQGVIWQYKIHKNWLARRKTKELSFSAPGFSFAGRTDFFKDIGLYDRAITGSGDTILIDCLLNSSEVHGYNQFLTPKISACIQDFRNKILEKTPRFDYIPIDIMHLYHGTVANRNYLPRHEILLDNDFDPYNDIRLENNVFEWNTDKPDLHRRLSQYFFDRKEDL